MTQVQHHTDNLIEQTTIILVQEIKRFHATLLNTVVKLAKKNYLCTKFNQGKNNIKGIWKFINSLLNKHKQSLNPTYFCTDDNNKITASKDIADAFNKYFVDTGSNLASKLPSLLKHSLVQDVRIHSS